MACLNDMEDVVKGNRKKPKKKFHKTHYSSSENISFAWLTERNK